MNRSSSMNPNAAIDSQARGGALLGDVSSQRSRRARRFICDWRRGFGAALLGFFATQKIFVALLQWLVAPEIDWRFPGERLSGGRRLLRSGSDADSERLDRLVRQRAGDFEAV